MEQLETAAPPSAHSVSTEATVAKMVIIKFNVIESCIHIYIFYMVYFGRSGNVIVQHY